MYSYAKCPQNKKCGVEKTLKMIGSKWTMYIIHHLFDAKRRFGQLQKLLDGISTKTLTVRLKELEREKIIHKKIYPVVPLHVEYSLTEKGKSLKEIFNKMARWGETHN